MSINVEDLVEGKIYRVHGNIPSYQTGMAKIIGKYRRGECGTVSGPCLHFNEAKLISLRNYTQKRQEILKLCLGGVNTLLQ
jgi:hypothetical protein